MGCILIIFIELFMLWCFFNYVISEEPDTKNFDGTEWGLYCGSAQRQVCRHWQLQSDRAITDNMSRRENRSSFKHELHARRRLMYSDSPGVKTMPIGY
jgi:hypothetical protein